MSRFVLTSFGSYGDLFPYIAVGRRLKQRGHELLIAAPGCYRAAVEQAGLEFAAVRPDVSFEDSETFRRAMDPRRGTEFIVRELLLPHLRESHQDLQAACQGADLLVSHALTYAAPIIGASTGLPWVSSVLSPMSFCSAYDPPALPPIPWLAHLRPLGPGVVGVLWRLLKKMGWSWSEPIRSFREELGLRADVDPLWEGQFSPHGVLALFSGQFASPQPDWPQGTTTCGFPFLDVDFGGEPDAERLGRFLDEGPPPLVFSLGSSAIQAADDFYQTAAEAAARVNQRAVLVVGDTASPENLPSDVLAIRSTSVHPLFEAASVVVHAGGIGTTGQAIRTGCPQFVIPFSHDQFDNALRVKRLGLGQTLDRGQLSSARLARGLEQLLASDETRTRVAAMATRLESENGADAACDVLEGVLETPARVDLASMKPVSG